MCPSQFLEYLLNLVSKVFPILAGVLVGFLMSEWRNRKTIYEQKRNKSLLGVAVIDSLMEEVRTGYKILLSAKQMGTTNQLLPFKTWSGMQTVNDEVLLRIIAVSKDEESHGPFHPREIRTQCKNYFEFLVGNFNKEVSARQPLKPFFNGTGDKFDESTKGVLDMLQWAKELLEQDANSRKPKG
jgi:hypothetical protein